MEVPWGKYQLIEQTDTFWAKALTIYGGESLSLHYHELRTELWFPLDQGLRGIINGSVLDLTPGCVYSVDKNVLHRIVNPTAESLRVMEIATGAVDNNDTICIYDKYRREIKNGTD